MMKDYFDQYGQLTIQKGIRTENAPYFRGQFELLNNQLNHYSPEEITPYLLHRLSYIKNGEDYFKSQIPEESDHLSPDNLIGIYMIHYARGWDYYFKNDSLEWKRLPVARLNGRWFLHPNLWMVTLCLHYPILLCMFFLPIHIMALISALRPKEETSTKILWYWKFYLLGLPWPFFWLDMNEIYQYYFSGAGRFSNEDMPLRVLSKKKWN